MSAFCAHEVCRFDSGARRGLGRHYFTRCQMVATQDPDKSGIPTKCVKHSMAAKEKAKEKREASYEKFLIAIEALKAKKAKR